MKLKKVVFDNERTINYEDIHTNEPILCFKEDVLIGIVYKLDKEYIIATRSVAQSAKEKLSLVNSMKFSSGPPFYRCPCYMYNTYKTEEALIKDYQLSGHKFMVQE